MSLSNYHSQTKYTSVSSHATKANPPKGGDAKLRV